jgi:hypothetical protein
MVLNDNFNNILVISWRSVLLVEETAVPNHILLYRVHLAMRVIQFHNVSGDRH